MVKIEFVDHLSEEINSKMREGLGNYESEHNIDVNYKSFFLILKDDDNEAIGILNAYLRLKNDLELLNETTLGYFDCGILIERHAEVFLIFFKT